MTVRLAFLASHNGSSAKAVVRACRDGVLRADPVLMISNNPDCAALEWARDAGMAALTVNRKTHADVDEAIAGAMKDHGVTVACCSGYMKLIGPKTITAVQGRILNVHPALLPSSYGGQGMYGRRVHEAVHAAGEKQTGITIHLVDGEYDRGDIIGRKIIALSQADTPDSIEAAVKQAEPDFYVETLGQYLADLPAGL